MAENPGSSHHTKAEDDLSSRSSSSTGSEDDNWDDFQDEVQPTTSLFEDRQFPDVEAALKYDKETHGFDLVGFSAKLGLDTFRRIRLINYIRSRKPSPQDIQKLSGTEELFADDALLKPIVEDDPMLQLQVGEWSDDEDPTAPGSTGKGKARDSGTASYTDVQDANREIQRLRERLAVAQKDLVDYRALVSNNMQNIASGSLGGVSIEEIRKEELPPAAPRDDDTHYFDSYNEQSIHYTMLTDRVRTSTYATFILSNPSLFKNAIVMDVGCGTGILSLFAARAGAKKVFAIEASKIADKAEANIKASGYGDVVTLIRGKVETVTLPEDTPKVDVIISEWMGYALLYESMLDSVLVARDRFLKPRISESPNAAASSPFEGVMAPSQTRMVLALCDPQPLIKQRVGFWKDVYGFDMSAMATETYEEAIVECIPKEELLSAPCVVKDLNLQSITSKGLSFSSPFTLKAHELPTSPAAKLQSGNTYFLGKLHTHRTYATAFVLWFDTFFHPKGEQYPEIVPCKVHTDHPEEWETGDVIKLKPSAKRRKTLESNQKPVIAGVPSTSPDDTPKPPPVSALAGSRQSSTSGTALTTTPAVTSNFEESREESFTTGPHGKPTHWKQAVFLLKTPIELIRGTEVSGTFYCRKSDTNSRELDFEFHYTITNTSNLGSPPPPGAQGTSKAGSSVSMPIVQCFRVR